MSDAKVIPGSPPEGVAEGAVFASRNELADAGVHGVRMQGIWTSEGRVIGIVLNGGYEDDEDRGDVVVYTGDGGRDPNSGKQIDDQGFTAGNRGLIVACALKTPIRVTRGWKCKSDLAPKNGFRYDGLYDVAAYQYVQGNEGFFVWRFTLRKRTSEQLNTGETNAISAGVGVEFWDESQGVDKDLMAALLREDSVTELGLGDSESGGVASTFQALQFTGVGNQVIRIAVPEGLNTDQGHGAAIVLRWRQYGDWDDTENYQQFTPNFEVNFVTSSGSVSSTSLLELYGYEGTRLLVFPELPVAMEVVSEARWSVQLDSVLNCPQISSKESGSCSTVFRFDTYTNVPKVVRVLSEGRRIEDIRHSGEFQLNAFGRYPGLSLSDTAVNSKQLLSSGYDVDSFTGSRVLPVGTILVEVLAPGRRWSLTIEDL